MAKGVPKIPTGPGGPNKWHLLIWLIPAAIEAVRKIAEEAPKIWDAAAEIRDRWRERKSRRSERAGSDELRLKDDQSAKPDQ